MLDAIIPTATYATTNGNGSFGYTAGVTKNAYRDSTAKSAGVALLNGKVGVWDGTYWRKQGTTTILSGDFVAEMNPANIEGVSGNGLVYTNTNSPFNVAYRLDTHFGVAVWSSAVCNSVNPRGNTTNVCESRGILIPTYSETQISTTSGFNPCGGTGNVGGAGVPSHTSGYSWSSTPSSANTDFYWVWSSSSYSGADYYLGLYVRCSR